MVRLARWIGYMALQSAIAAQLAYAAEPGGYIGAGIATVPDYEGSDDHETVASLFGGYQWETGRYVDLSGNVGSSGQAVRLKANLIAESMSKIWDFGPVLQYREDRKSTDNRNVDRLAEIDGAFEAGAFVGLAIDPWTASVTVVTDISDEHEGSLVEFAGAYHLPVDERLRLSLGAQATYADDDYMDTYFGVSGSDSLRSGLTTFDADGGFKDVGVSLTARYRASRDWSLIGFASYSRLLGDAADSPLVDDVGDENQYSAGIGASYHF